MIKTSSIEFLKEIFKIFINNDVVTLINYANRAEFKMCTCRWEYPGDYLTTRMQKVECDNCQFGDKYIFENTVFHIVHEKKMLSVKIDENYLIDDISFLDLINFDKITIDLSKANFGDGVLFQLNKNIKRKYYIQVDN